MKHNNKNCNLGLVEPDFMNYNTTQEVNNYFHDITNLCCSYSFYLTSMDAVNIQLYGHVLVI